MWAVRCEVWGGVTGYHQGLLRADGGIQIFPTEEAAQARADECKQAVRHHAGTAQFWYEPIQVPVTLGENNDHCA